MPALLAARHGVCARPELLRAVMLQLAVELRFPSSHALAAPCSPMALGHISISQQALCSQRLSVAAPSSCPPWRVAQLPLPPMASGALAPASRISVALQRRARL
uniref:Uncharacterized protein n=1 Tax=Zea mays TaxID=4577 RepID=A0A804N3M6_MAIZE